MKIEKIQITTNVKCSTCQAETSPYALFPGDICLACYEKTPEANAPLTAQDFRKMWGIK